MALPVGRLACSSVQQHRPAQPRQHTVLATRAFFVRPARRPLQSCSAGAATGAWDGRYITAAADGSRDSSVWATQLLQVQFLHASLANVYCKADYYLIACLFPQGSLAAA
jgi:hypothetical protein